MTTDASSVHDALLALIPAHFSGSTEIRSLQRLSAGASMETWSFDAVGPQGAIPLILRRRPPGAPHPDQFALLRTEATIIQAAAAARVPAPVVRYVLRPEDGLGGGFLMERIAGETIPRRILRSQGFNASRLVQQVGAAAAAIHAVPIEQLPEMKTAGLQQSLDDLHREHLAQDQARPVFELAFKWLRDHTPATAHPVRLVHGDLRMGNLMVGGEGLRAVLDWELAHLGDPMEDLAWFCLPPWRFGEIDRQAGGLGSREELFAAYESVARESVDRERVRYWETIGSLRWGLICSGMVGWFRSGRDRGVERAMIARRASESELDLLRMSTSTE